MTKKNICFYSGDITNSGGTERVAIIIANELNKLEEYNVSVLSLVEKEKEPFFALDRTIPRYAIYDHVVRGITHIGGIINRTRKMIKKHNIDILIDIDGILEMYTIPAKRFTKVKIISWEHYNFYQHPVVPYRKYTRKMAARWADAIVTLTEEDKGYYTSNLNVRCPIQCIYNPVIWKKNTKEYDSQSKIILSVGRLTYQKGFDILIDVADLFLKGYPDWKWIVLGEGEDREILEKKVMEKGLDKQLLFPGNVDDIDEYYAKASVFVMTSRFEGLPMTLLETKPYKLPIVSFDCKTGPKELVQDGINGYLIPEGENKEMAEAICKLIDNEKERKEFSEHAIIDMEKFELTCIMNHWIELLKEIMS
ncbi:MAG: glycosyltransferase family 4 protein [Eubacterium sp.]